MFCILVYAAWVFMKCNIEIGETMQNFIDGKLIFNMLYIFFIYNFKDLACSGDHVVKKSI
jgi:hypothetical protein